MEPTNIEKRQKRLARNKESARKSRNRKKHYQEFLENKVKVLAQEANALRNQLYQKSEELVLSSAPNKELRSKIDTISEKLFSTCSQRKEHIKFIIEEVIDVMIPSHAKFLILACQSTDVAVPELTAEQIHSIKELQPVIIQEQKKLNEVVTELRSVRNELEGILDWASDLPQQLTKLLTIDKTAELLGGDQIGNF